MIFAELTGERQILREIRPNPADTAGCRACVTPWGKRIVMRVMSGLARHLRRHAAIARTGMALLSLLAVLSGVPGPAQAHMVCARGMRAMATAAAPTCARCHHAAHGHGAPCCRWTIDEGQSAVAPRAIAPANAGVGRMLFADAVGLALPVVAPDRSPVSFVEASRAGPPEFSGTPTILRL